MQEAVEIFLITFDSLENNVSDAVHRKSLGIFIDDVSGDDRLTAYGKAAKYINKMPAMSHQLGHNGNVYPKIKIKKHILK